MKKLALALLVSTSPAWAQNITWNSAKDFWTENVKSVSLKSSMPSLSTDYSLEIDGKQREVFFQTNVTGNYTYAIETKYFDLGVTVPGSSYEEDIENTDYSDFYFKTQMGDFEVTYHQAQFNGGNANEGPLTPEDAFYQDYQVKKNHLRVSYYINTQFNKILDQPINARKIRGETGKNYFSSWMATVGYDDSQTRFPNLTASEGAELFDLKASNFKNAGYIQNLDTRTLYYSFGYAGLHMLTMNLTYDFKLTFGNGRQEANYLIQGEEQSDIGTSRYVEFDMGTNYLINETHNIGLKIESYTHSTDIGTTTIDSRASQVFLFYQYII